MSQIHTITIDRELCMGSGLCIMYAAETFAHDDETKAVVIDQPAADLEDVRAAVEACPTGAIRLTIEGE